MALPRSTEVASPTQAVETGMVGLMFLAASAVLAFFGSRPDSSDLQSKPAAGFALISLIAGICGLIAATALRRAAWGRLGLDRRHPTPLGPTDPTPALHLLGGVIVFVGAIGFLMLGVAMTMWIVMGAESSGVRIRRFTWTGPVSLVLGAVGVAWGLRTIAQGAFGIRVPVVPELPDIDLPEQTNGAPLVRRVDIAGRSIGSANDLARALLAALGATATPTPTFDEIMATIDSDPRPVDLRWRGAQASRRLMGAEQFADVVRGLQSIEDRPDVPPGTRFGFVVD